MLWHIVIVASSLFMHQAVGMSLDAYEDEFITTYFKSAFELLNSAHDVKPEYLQKIGVQLEDMWSDGDAKYSLLCAQCYFKISNFLTSVMQNLNDSTFQEDASVPQLCSSCHDRLEEISKSYNRFMNEKVVSGDNKMIVGHNQSHLSYFFQRYFRLNYLLPPVIILGFYVAGLFAKKHQTAMYRRFIAVTFLKYYPFKLLKTFTNE